MAQVTSAISDADKERIRRICKEKDWNQSQLIRKLLKSYLDSEEKIKDTSKDMIEISSDDAEFNEKANYVIKRILESEGDDE